jgi:hypothetical protein
MQDFATCDPLSPVRNHTISLKIWCGPMMRVRASRVENRRSEVSLPVGVRRGFRQVLSIRFALVLFPVPAHRTGTGRFPGSGSRKRLTLSPRFAIRWV